MGKTGFDFSLTKKPLNIITYYRIGTKNQYKEIIIKKKCTEIKESANTK